MGTGVQRTTAVSRVRIAPHPEVRISVARVQQRCEMGLEFSAQEVTVRRTTPEGRPKRRREQARRVRAMVRREFVAAAAGHRQAAQGGQRLHHGGLSGSVLANKECNRRSKLQIERTHGWQVERVVARVHSSGLHANAEQVRDRPSHLSGFTQQRSSRPAWPNCHPTDQAVPAVALVSAHSRSTQ